MKLWKEFNIYWIDQQNIPERSHQVQTMREIYSCAESVFLWLGEEDTKSYSNHAMAFLTKRKHTRCDEVDFRRFSTYLQATGIIRICQRPYWTRIWILQELLLAEDVAMYFSSRSIPWHDFQRFFDDLQRGRERHIRASFVLDSPSGKYYQCQKGWTERQPQPIMSLLRLCCNQEATDKVYALHGLANNTHGLTINYGITVEQLLKSHSSTRVFHSRHQQAFVNPAKNSIRQVAGCEIFYKLSAMISNSVPH
jgi:hypothetical protein